MFSQAFHLSFFVLFFLIFLRTLAAADPPAYKAVDLILLDCGSSTNLNDLSGRSWDADERSTYTPANAANISTASVASHSKPSVANVPYETARVFRSMFTYSFRVSTGHKFIRLYFYPDVYAGFNTSQSLFSVTANGFTLLSNFSAFSTYLSHPYQPSFEKEYIINVKDDQKLNLTFSPNPNSFAFINGIEIVSLPDELYSNNGRITFLYSEVPATFDNDTALETLYRLNVGGATVQIQDDTGMFRSWANDENYIFGGNFGYMPHDSDHPINYTLQTSAYTAPKIVYRTSRVIANHSKGLQWSFPVDTGLHYLFRLHFCEIQLEVTKHNQRVFTVNIGNQTAENNADVIAWTGGAGIPTYRDYIAWVPDDGRRGKTDLRLTLLPNIGGAPMYSNALLNGLEIFKLNDSNQSLAAANPSTLVINSPPLPPANPSTLVINSPSLPPDVKQQENSNRGAAHGIFIAVGGIIGVVAVIGAVSFLIFRRRLRVGCLITTRPSGASLLSSDLCRHFSLEEIKLATGKFDYNFVIGKGGFGNVYKGFMNNGATIVAIKRLHASSNQGAQEFRMEIELLSKLRHIHLVSLMGYCDEKGEMILIYDYMAHGTLRDHLYNCNNPPLTWKHRLQICLGAAKGLQYLHTGTRHAIIHRDVKSTNILLDDKWIAKVSDFGLSKVCPSDASNTHISTAVKGSFGYFDPEYYKLQQLTDKSDVYSFGVVLFEVLCARPVILAGLADVQVNLAEWAKYCYREGTIDEIVDSNIKDQIAPECLNKFVETAIICLRGKRTKRPAMSEVVRSLEVAMQLQEGGTADCRDSIVSAAPAFEWIEHIEANATLGEVDMISGATEIVSASKNSGLQSGQEVLSDLVNPSGR